ncbi:flagellin [Bacillus sp. 1P02SD]
MISLIQTAEGALNESHSILQRMRELAVQSSNDTNTASDREEIQKEINQLTTEIDRIANTTEFNTQKLLDGSKVGLKDKIDGSVTAQNNSSMTTFSATATSTDALTKTGTITITRVTDTAGTGADFIISDPTGTTATLTNTTTLTGFGSNITLTDLTGMKTGENITISVGKMEAASTDVSKAVNLQIGANSGQNMLVGISSMKATDLGLRDSSGDAINIETSGKATAAITAINSAIEKVSAERSKLGAYQNRLDHTINNLGTSSENLTAAESRIRDVDYALAA